MTSEKREMFAVVFRSYERERVDGASVTRSSRVHSLTLVATKAIDKVADKMRPLGAAGLQDTPFLSHVVGCVPSRGVPGKMRPLGAASLQDTPFLSQVVGRVPSRGVPRTMRPLGAAGLQDTPFPRSEERRVG